FFGTAIMTLAAARFGSTRFSDMSISTMTPDSGIAVAAPTGSSFDLIKQIDAGVLNVGYAEAGPANGPPVVLLHGWPYDIHAFEGEQAAAAAEGRAWLVVSVLLRDRAWRPRLQQEHQ